MESEISSSPWKGRQAEGAQRLSAPSGLARVLAKKPAFGAALRWARTPAPPTLQFRSWKPPSRKTERE